jgi:hypothetical protein
LGHATQNQARRYAAALLRCRLSNPKAGQESSDVKMVGHIVHRLVDTYERKHGEEFDGLSDAQWDRLFDVAQAMLGNTIGRKMLKKLIRSYLNSH